MAFLKERSNTYYACWYDPRTGKKVTRSTGIPVDSARKPGAPRESKATLKKKAELIAATMERSAKGDITAEQARAAVESIISGNKNLPTVRAYAENYLRNHRNNSKKNDKKAIEYFLEFLGQRADHPLNTITAHDCKEFIQWRLTDPATCNRPATVRRHRETLSAIFNQAVDQELLNRNPWKKANVPKVSPYDVPENKRIALTPEQIAALMQTMPGEWPDLIAFTVMTMGQRLGDVARLRWQQVDRKRDILHMRTGKTKANLDLPLTYGMKDLLNRLESSRVDDYIFPRSRVKHERSGKLSLDFRKACIELGFINPEEAPELPGNMRHISEISFHSLRKSVVTTGRQTGIAPDVMRSLVGQDSEEIQRLYFTPSDAYLAEQADKIQKQLLPPQADSPQQ